jgi:hypothetical protein
MIRPNISWSCGAIEMDQPMLVIRTAHEYASTRLNDGRSLELAFFAPASAFPLNQGAEVS